MPRNREAERWRDMAQVARIYEQLGEATPRGTFAPFVESSACHCERPDHAYRGSESVYGAPVTLPTESIEDWQCLNCGATWTFNRDLTKGDYRDEDPPLALAPDVAQEDA